MKTNNGRYRGRFRIYREGSGCKHHAKRASRVSEQYTEEQQGREIGGQVLLIPETLPLDLPTMFGLQRGYAKQCMDHRGMNSLHTGQRKLCAPRTRTSSSTSLYYWGKDVLCLRSLINIYKVHLSFVVVKEPILFHNYCTASPQNPNQIG